MEVNELFLGWEDFPPTNLLLKALVEGFGGGKPAHRATEPLEIPPEAAQAMQDSAMAAIVAKAGSRLPIVRGRDPGLPKTPPVFDLEALRKRNAEATAKRKARSVGGGS